MIGGNFAWGMMKLNLEEPTGSKYINSGKRR